MEPKIIQLDAYGDYRDNLKTSIYTYKLDFEKILYNLTTEDCSFILRTLYKNIVFSEDVETGNIYNTIEHYRIFERGTERWIRITMMDEKGELNRKSFQISFDTETKHLDIHIGGGSVHDLMSDASAVIMIYEHFLKKYE